MTGYIKLHRGFLTCDIFTEEPYTEREAFLYLIIHAAWKDRAYRVGNKIISLKRGQHTASLRYLAEAWKWKKDKVADFLKILQSSDMIQTDTKTGQNVITICNYNKYQDEDSKSQTDDRQIPDSYQTDSRQLPDKTEEGKEGKEGKDSDDFEKWWKVYPRKVGKGASRKSYETAIKKIAHAELIAITNRYQKGVNETDVKFIPHPATWLSQERWSDEPEMERSKKPGWML